MGKNKNKRHNKGFDSSGHVPVPVTADSSAASLGSANDDVDDDSDSHSVALGARQSQTAAAKFIEKVLVPGGMRQTDTWRIVLITSTSLYYYPPPPGEVSFKAHLPGLGLG